MFPLPQSPPVPREVENFLPGCLGCGQLLNKINIMEPTQITFMWKLKKQMKLMTGNNATWYYILIVEPVSTEELVTVSSFRVAVLIQALNVRQFLPHLLSGFKLKYLIAILHLGSIIGSIRVTIHQIVIIKYKIPCTWSFGMEILEGCLSMSGISKHPLRPANHLAATSGSLVRRCKAAVQGVSRQKEIRKKCIFAKYYRVCLLVDYIALTIWYRCHLSLIHSKITFLSRQSPHEHKTHYTWRILLTK